MRWLVIVLVIALCGCEFGHQLSESDVRSAMQSAMEQEMPRQSVAYTNAIMESLARAKFAGGWSCELPAMDLGAGPVSPTHLSGQFIMSAEKIVLEKEPDVSVVTTSGDEESHKVRHVVVLIILVFLAGVFHKLLWRGLVFLVKYIKDECKSTVIKETLKTLT